MPDTHAAAAIAVMAAMTALLRFLPFAVFGGRRTPALVAQLGKLLPCAIMGMLVVYCLKDVRFSSLEGFVPQLIAGVFVAAVCAKTKNALLAIITGTALYMVLVQVVF